MLFGAKLAKAKHSEKLYMFEMHFPIINRERERQKRKGEKVYRCRHIALHFDVVEVDEVLWRYVNQTLFLLPL